MIASSAERKRCVSLPVARYIRALCSHPGGLTWWERLLQLLGLLAVLEHERVQVPLTSDLELDLLAVLVSLDARRCCPMVRIRGTASRSHPHVPLPLLPRGFCYGFVCRGHEPDASLRRQISMNCGQLAEAQIPDCASSWKQNTFLISPISRGILADFASALLYSFEKFAGRNLRVSLRKCVRAEICACATAGRGSPQRRATRGMLCRLLPVWLTRLLSLLGRRSQSLEGCHVHPRPDNCHQRYPLRVSSFAQSSRISTWSALQRYRLVCLRPDQRHPDLSHLRHSLTP